MLHSGGRRFGPLDEDELRNYFRAGMVKSVDRISAPGDVRMRAAAEVALELGETVPQGPPPPPLDPVPAPPVAPPAPVAPVATPVPPAAVAAPVAGDAAAAEAERQQRAARAIAAMKIDLAAMQANAPERAGKSWLVPIVLVVVMIGALMFGLNMLKKMAATSSPHMAPAPGADAMSPPPAEGFPGEASGPRPAEPAPAARAPEASMELQANFRRADELMQSSQWAKLVEHARTWSQAQPERNEPLQFLGVAYARLGDYNAAADALTRILARDPSHANARTLLADTYLQAKRYEEAAGLYRGLVAQNPSDPRLWNNYATVLNELGQRAQAVAALETAVKLDPGFKQAWKNLGNTYQAMGDNARAAAAFASAR